MGYSPRGHTEQDTGLSTQAHTVTLDLSCLARGTVEVSMSVKIKVIVKTNIKQLYWGLYKVVRIKVALVGRFTILKSRDITLPTKVHLVKAMVFPVVMYGYESWTMKKAER